MAVVYDVARDELFAALGPGGGAEVNGQALPRRGSDVGSSLANSVIGAEPTAFAQFSRPCLRALYALSPPTVRGVRVMGNTSLSLAWVACGRLSAFFSLDGSASRSPGALLVCETGGHVTDCKGQELIASAGSICAASNEETHRELLEVLRQVGSTEADQL